MKQTNKKSRSVRKVAPSFKTYIYKVLKVVHPGISISGDAIGQLDEYVKTMAMKLSEGARHACLRAGKSTVGAAEIELATNLYFPKELATHASKNANDACVKFREGKESSESSKGKKKTKDGQVSSVRREVQAGLSFSVALAEKYIREFGTSELNVSKNASIVLASTLEYITAEIIELAGNLTKDHKKVTILIRYVFLAISNDEELQALSRSMGIEFVGSGVVPHIHDSLKPTKEKRAEQAARRRKNKSKNPTQSNTGIKKPRKFLPGTKALLEINKHQRLTELLLQKLPFERDVRNIANSLNETIGLKGIHFGSGSIIVLQRFVESRVAKICSASVDLAVHGQRDGVNGSDVMLAWKMTEPMFPYSESMVTEIGRNGIERLAFQGGVKRKSKDMYEVLMKFIYSIISTVLYRTLYIVQHQDVITVGVKHLRDAFRSLGINFTITPSMGKPRVKKSTTSQPESPRQNK